MLTRLATTEPQAVPAAARTSRLRASPARALSTTSLPVMVAAREWSTWSGSAAMRARGRLREGGTRGDRLQAPVLAAGAEPRPPGHGEMPDVKAQGVPVGRVEHNAGPDAGAYREVQPR